MEERGGIFEWLREEKESPTTLLSKVLVYQKNNCPLSTKRPDLQDTLPWNQFSPHVTGVRSRHCASRHFRVLLKEGIGGFWGKAVDPGTLNTERLNLQGQCVIAGLCVRRHLCITIPALKLFAKKLLEQSIAWVTIL